MFSPFFPLRGSGHHLGLPQRGRRRHPRGAARLRAPGGPGAGAGPPAAGGLGLKASGRGLVFEGGAGGGGGRVSWLPGMAGSEWLFSSFWCLVVGCHFSWLFRSCLVVSI